MVLRIEKNIKIEDLRHHPAEVVEKLQTLLTGGAVAHQDPHRDSFYEIESNGRVYYICVSPVTGKVLLLGTWLASDVSSSQAA